MTLSLNTSLTLPYTSSSIEETETQLTINPILLLRAVQNCDLEFLRENLSKFPAEVINIVIEGEVLLTSAIKTGSIPVIQYLIQNKARLDLADSEKLTPLDYAAMSPNSKEILPALIGEWICRDRNLISTYLNDNSLMTLASQSVKQLKIDTNLINDSHTITLIKSYLTNPSQKEEIIQALYETVAQPLDQNGNTLLHLLVQLSPLAPQIIYDLVKSLLDKGANPNIENFFGQTPLHTACAEQSFLINLLSLHKADFFKTDGQGVPPVALISIESLKKDPLKLETLDVMVAAFVVLNQITKSFYTSENSNDLVAGFASVPELVNYSFLLSQWALLINKKGIASVLPSITTSIIIHALLNGISLTEGKHIVPMLAALPIGVMMVSAFKGLNTAWKNKALKPLKAIRNIAVHSINFSYALYESANMVNNLANHVWHTYHNRFDQFKSVELELKSLENATNTVKEQMKEVTILSQQTCADSSPGFNKRLCEELTCIKDRQLELENQFLSDITLNQQKLQKINEEFQSKTVLSELWNFITKTKSADQIHLETLNINPFSQEFKTNPAKVIKQQYHKLSLETHPDKCAQNMKEICEAQFNKLSEAFKFFQQA